MDTRPAYTSSGRKRYTKSLMVRIFIISMLSIVIIAGVYMLLVFAKNVEQTPPLIEQEKKGRAQYLLDTRLPRLDIKWPGLWGSRN